MDVLPIARRIIHNSSKLVADGAAKAVSWRNSDILPAFVVSMNARNVTRGLDKVMLICPHQSNGDATMIMRGILLLDVLSRWENLKEGAMMGVVDERRPGSC